MIKITNGVYGVNRLNSKSAPVTLTKEEEARLVRLGIAEYVPAAPEVNTVPGFEYTPETAAVETAPKTAVKAKAKKAKK